MGSPQRTESLPNFWRPGWRRASGELAPFSGRLLPGQEGPLANPEKRLAANKTGVRAPTVCTVVWKLPGRLWPGRGRATDAV